MPISIRCECGQGFRVKDRLAGKALKCPKCGALLRVPEPEVYEDVSEPVEEADVAFDDPLDDLLSDALAEPLGPAPVLSGPVAQRTTLSRQQWMILVGAVGVLVSLIVVSAMATRRLGLASWVPDSDLLAELSEEVSAGEFLIRRPKEFTTGFSRLGNRSELRPDSYHWVGPWGDLSIVVTSHPDHVNRTRPTVHSRPRAGAISILDGNIYILPVADTSYGHMGDLNVTRITFDALEKANLRMFKGKRGAQRYNLIYVTYDGTNRIEVLASCKEDFKSERFRLLDAAARTLRIRKQNSQLVPTQHQHTERSAIAGERPRQPKPTQKSQQPRKIRQSQPAIATRPALPRPPPPLPSNEPSVGQPPSPPAKTPGWMAEPDPPAKPFEIAANARASFPLPSGDEIRYPHTHSPFVMISANDDHVSLNLSTGSVLGKFTTDEHFSSTCAFSGEGRYFAVDTSRFREPIVDVWSFESGNRLHQFDLAGEEGHASLRSLAFSGPDELLVLKELRQGCLVETWDLKTGKTVNQFVVPKTKSEEFGKDLALSPGRRYIAMIMGKSRVEVYEIKTGKKAGQIMFPAIRYGGCDGLAFSPDGTELAALFRYTTNNLLERRLLCWDFSTGRTVLNRTYGRELKPELMGRLSVKAFPLQWMPDKSGLLFYGLLVVDRQTGAPLWTLGRRSIHPRPLTADRLVRVDEDRILRLVETPLAPIALAVEAVRDGGEAIDASMPPLTKPDWTRAESTAPDAKPPDWSASPDPKPPIPAGDYRSFSKPGRVFKEGLLGGRGLGQAVTYQTKSKTDGVTRTICTRRFISSYDFAVNSTVGTVEIPDANYHLLDINPLNNQVLVGLTPHERLAASRLDVWSPADKMHVVGWRPYAHEKTLEQKRVTEARWVDDKHVLTLNVLGRLVLWKLPECRAKYMIGDARHLAGLSPNGKYAVVYHAVGSRPIHQPLRIYETLTGKCCGSLEHKSSQPVQYVAFRRDGERIAFVDPHRSRFDDKSIALWDAKTGKLEREIPIPPYLGHKISNASWINDHYLVIGGFGNSILVDLENRALRWRFKSPQIGTAMIPWAGHLWSASYGGVRGAPIDFEQIERETGPLTAETQAIVYPGTRVGVDVHVQRRVNLDVEELLREKIAANGWIIDPSAETRVSFRATEEKSEAVRSAYPSSTGPRRKRQLQTNDIVYVLQVKSASGDRVWKNERRQRFNILLARGDDPIASVYRMMWTGVEMEVDRMKIPAWLYPKSRLSSHDASLDTLGAGYTDFSSKSGKLLFAEGHMDSPDDISKSIHAQMGHRYDHASREVVREAYVDFIATYDIRRIERLRWYPGAKRPLLGMRWGLGVFVPGKTEQPKIERVSDVRNYADWIGETLFYELNDRIINGAFGLWQVTLDSRFRQATLGGGIPSRLQATARTLKLDAMMILEVGKRFDSAMTHPDATLKIHLIDVRGGQPRWASPVLSRSEISAAETTDTNPAAELITEVTTYMDDNYRLQEMPKISAAVARQRTALLTTERKEDPLHILAEIRYYHAKSLLTDQDAARYYDAVLGAGQGLALLKGTVAERQQLLRAWLEKRDAANGASAR